MIKVTSLKFSILFCREKRRHIWLQWKVPQDILLGQRNKEKHWREVCAVDGSQGVSLHWTPLGQRLSCLYMINSSRLFNNKKDVITTLIINTGNQIRQHKILSDFFFLWSYLFEDSYAQILNKSVPIATLEFKEKI